MVHGSGYSLRLWTHGNDLAGTYVSKPVYVPDFTFLHILKRLASSLPVLPCQVCQLETVPRCLALA